MRGYNIETKQNKVRRVIVSLILIFILFDVNNYFGIIGYLKPAPEIPNELVSKVEYFPWTIKLHRNYSILNRKNDYLEIKGNIERENKKFLTIIRLGKEMDNRPSNKSIHLFESVKNGHVVNYSLKDFTNKTINEESLVENSTIVVDFKIDEFNYLVLLSPPDITFKNRFYKDIDQSDSIFVLIDDILLSIFPDLNS